MKYYIIAGEASGDLHGSNLIKELQDFDPDAEFRAWGGDRMQNQGAVLVKHYRELAFMGFSEVIANLRTIFKNLKFCRDDIREYQPDVLILIDYPGFNLRMAGFAHKEKIPVFYYISPQIWAWKQSRLKKIRDYVDRMFVILPFESDFYAINSYQVDYVGHPLLDIDIFATRELIGRDELDQLVTAPAPIVALLPGSRKQEISRMLPVMLKLIPEFPDHKFVIASAPSVPPEYYRSITGEAKVDIVQGETYDLLSKAAAAIVTSGTATLETALMKVPQVVCYKGNYLSYLIARKLIKVRYIALPNLILNKMIVKELIQREFNIENLIRELGSLLNDWKRRSQVLSDYAVLRIRLGSRGASRETATLMIRYLQEIKSGKPWRL